MNMCSWHHEKRRERKEGRRRRGNILRLYRRSLHGAIKLGPHALKISLGGEDLEGGSGVCGAIGIEKGRGDRGGGCLSWSLRGLRRV